jgi:hypothetical protein
MCMVVKPTQLVAGRTRLSVLLKAMYGGGFLFASSDVILPVIFFLLICRLECLRLSAVEVQRGAFQLGCFLRKENMLDRRS